MKLFFALFHQERKRQSTGLSFSFSQVWIGVEPTNDGFADRSLTAWVPHQKCVVTISRKKSFVYRAWGIFFQIDGILNEEKGSENQILQNN